MPSIYLVLASVAAAIYFLVPRLWAALLRAFIVKETGFYDVDYLGKPRSSKDKIPGTVVICGGSIAGLITARVCHDHFERVVIVESENWLDTEDARLHHSWNQKSTRARVMQYSSIQGNQPILYKGLSHLFPNFDEECKASDIGVDSSDYKFNFFGHSLVPPSERYGGQLPKTLFASRRGLETLLRRLVLDPKSYPNIQQVIGTVTGISVDESRTIKAALVRDREGMSKEIPATLFIDCTGPTQAGTKWLQRAGFAQDVKRDAFSANMHYKTFLFHITPELGAKLPIPGGYNDIGGAVIVRTPDGTRDRRYFGAAKAEGRSLQVCCGSWGIDDLPDTVDGIIQHAQAMITDKPLPSWYTPFLEMLHEAEDTAEITAAHVGPSYWTRYERSSNLPVNFVAIGDSVCRINPIYGQGCAKALMGVMAMNTILDQHRDEARLPKDFARRVFQSQANKTDPMWQTTKAIDYGQPTTTPVEGETSDQGKLIRWLSRQLQILGETDRQAASTLWRSLTMMDSASIEMMHPVLIFKVLRQVLSGKELSVNCSL